MIDRVHLPAFQAEATVSYSCLRANFGIWSNVWLSFNHDQPIVFVCVFRVRWLYSINGGNRWRWLRNWQRFQIPFNGSEAHMNGVCLLETSHCVCALRHGDIQLFPVSTYCHAVHLANVKTLNELLDPLFILEVCWYARKSYRPVRDSSLGAEVLLSNFDDLARVRKYHVNGDSGEQVREDNVHPEVVFLKVLREAR
jgi:hypothetical protein